MVTEKSAIVSTENIPLQLSPEIIKGLETYEDFLSYYIQLSQASDAVLWQRADLLLIMKQKLGEKSVKELAKDIKVPASTIDNYTRTAKAFISDQRDMAASFTLHMQASFADEYDTEQEIFLTDCRFGWLHKALDERLSTRMLQDQIQRQKKKEEAGQLMVTCSHCGLNSGEVKPYVLYSPGQRKRAVRIELHENCYLKILDYIHGRPTN